MDGLAWHPEKVRALLLDLDGVLYVEDSLIEGSRQAVDQLRAKGLELRFVTNTTSRPHAAVLEHLRELGFELEAEHLITPASLAVQHCREQGIERVALVMRYAAKEDFTDLVEDRENPEAVIVGDLGSGFDYGVMNRAFGWLMDGAELVALQKNRYWQRSGGLVLDVGPFVAALEYATGMEARTAGKPDEAFFAGALAGTGSGHESAAMVGDDIDADIGGAQAAGIPGILVRTGKYREDQVAKSGIDPAITVDSIADIPALFD